MGHGKLGALNPKKLQSRVCLSWMVGMWRSKTERLKIVEKEFSCMANFYVIVFSVYVYFLLQLQMKVVRGRDCITGCRSEANWLSDMFLYFGSQLKHAHSGGMCRRWFETRFWEEIRVPLCSSMIYCRLKQNQLSCKAILTARPIESDRAEAKIIDEKTKDHSWEVYSFGVISRWAGECLPWSVSTLELFVV